MKRWETLLGAGWRQKAKIRSIERRVLQRVDGIWTCSPVDAARIAAIYPSGPPPQIVPNGIPRIEATPQSLSPRNASADGPTLLFLGHLRWSPNVFAAMTLATKILPLLQTRLRSARLILAGRNPSSRILQLQGSTVDVIADPPDVTSLLQTADIVVVPLIAGSGTRIKIIEAMAWGIPVVATPLAVEGLALTDGLNVRLAKATCEFAAAIIALWTDQVGYAAQRAAAHAHAFSHFGPAAIDEAVTEGLRMAAAPMNL